MKKIVFIINLTLFTFVTSFLGYCQSDNSLIKFIIKNESESFKATLSKTQEIIVFKSEFVPNGIDFQYENCTIKYFTDDSLIKYLNKNNSELDTFCLDIYKVYILDSIIIFEYCAGFINKMNYNKKSKAMRVVYSGEVHLSFGNAILIKP